MKKDYILFIDSGIGGLSTLATCYKSTIANYIYYADNFNAPYGNHSRHELYSFLKAIISNITKKYSIKIVILACNTATTSSINELRQHFKHITFIGTEPALCLAMKLKYKKILSIATPTTINQIKYKELADKKNVKITSFALSNFAKSIEEYFTTKNIYSYFCVLKNIYYIAAKSRQFDCLVLGCTHYVLVNDKIGNIAKIKTVNGNIGVSNQLIRCFQNNFQQKSEVKTIKFMVSNNKNHLKQIYKKIFNEILAKT